MKQLRRTIRRILLESQQQYDKIVSLVMSCDPMNVNSALMLAESMGFLQMVNYDTSEQEEFVRGSFNEKETVTKHRWEFVPDPVLLDKLWYGWKNPEGGRHKVFGVGHHKKPAGDKIAYVILINDKPSDRR